MHIAIGRRFGVRVFRACLRIWSEVINGLGRGTNLGSYHGNLDCGIFCQDIPQGNAPCGSSVGSRSKRSVTE